MCSPRPMASRSWNWARWSWQAGRRPRPTARRRRPSPRMPEPAQPTYPALYQVNTRVWLTELGSRLGRQATLDDIPDGALDDLAAAGYDWVWLLSVWQTGAASRQVSLDDPGLRAVFQQTLPDLQEADIAGSGFAITGYTVASSLGGDEALARLRVRLRERGLR